MDSESEDIQSYSILTHYQHRARALENYSLADFTSQLRIEYPKNVTFEDPFDDNLDDDILDSHDDKSDEGTLLELPNGIVIKKRKVPRVIRYVNYNVKKDPQNHYRERLMLFLPWRNEETDLYGGFKTHEEHYKAKNQLIAPIRKKYEKYNDELEVAVEEIENEEFDDIYDDID